MNQETTLVVFLVNQQRCGLPIASVERTTRAAAITPLPQAPEVVAGVINLGGRVLPVIDVRRRLGLPPRPMRLSDQLIVARLRQRTVALLVEAVTGLETVTTTQVVAEQTILPNMTYVAGVAKLPDGLLLIHDLDRFLSLDEERALDEALA